MAINSRSYSDGILSSRKSFSSASLSATNDREVIDNIHAHLLGNRRYDIICTVLLDNGDGLF